MTLVEPGVTSRKPVSGGRRKKSSKRKAREPPPSERGTHAYSIPQAGRMIGLSRGASYEAAKRGEIPTQQYGDRLIVPKAIWDRRLGLED
jgi:hypothetical protein